MRTAEPDGEREQEQEQERERATSSCRITVTGLPAHIHPISEHQAKCVSKEHTDVIFYCEYFFGPKTVRNRSLQISTSRFRNAEKMEIQKIVSILCGFG